MPFNSVIEAKRRLVVTTGTGILTGEEGLACCRQLKERRDFDPTFNQLLDLTDATRFDATPSQLQVIAAQPFFSHASRRAIVAKNPTIFGLARMFESYRSLSGFGEQVMVFSELDPAVQWIDSAASDENLSA
jgi:hypothetical protein